MNVRATCLLLLVCAAAACRRDDAPGDPTAAGTNTLQEVTERGPVTVTLALTPKHPTLADRIRLQITVAIAPDHDFAFPRFGEQLEQFGILDYRTSPAVPDAAGRLNQTRTYTLEPLLSGDYTIPAMTVPFWARAAGTNAMHTAETRPLTVTVRSLLAGDAAALDIRDIVGPRRLPRRVWPWYAGIGGTAALALIIAAIVWFRRRRRLAAAPVPEVPPHEAALQALRLLIDEHLPEQGEYKRFYQRISDILRRYIESRFGLHAPEQTTEEFLDHLRASRQLDAQYRPLLAEFLRHCDLVKFAELQPDDRAVQHTFDACKMFILGTKEDVRLDA